MFRLAVSLTVLLLGAIASSAEPAASKANGHKLFATKVLPLFRAKCFACHGDDAQDVRGAFDMRSLDGLIAGGESGEASIVPGEPDASPLVKSIEWDGLEMPPKENDRLSEDQIATIRAWIAAGAPWPSDDEIKSLAKSAWDDESGVRVATSGGLTDEWTNRRYDPADLWAYQPLKRPAVPAQASSSRNPIDAFLDEALREAGLGASDSADRQTLLRRATFDLTGLPPARGEIAAFVADDRDDAFERLIDRLLASPHYGEQAARHWLDVTRYADSAGFSNDFERPHAWRYRDYVIRSFNDDKPFDRFVIEQLAGDELDSDDPEMLIAVSFLRMGPWEHTGMSVAAVTRQQYLDDVTNSVGETFLATGMTCCRCHDHKFDPIPTRDYYRLQAVFAPVQFADRDVPFIAAENLNGIDEERARVESLLEDKDALRLVHAPDATAQQRDEAALALKKLGQKRQQSLEREQQRFKPLAMSVYDGPPIERRSNVAYHPLPKPMARKGDPQEVFILAGGSLEAPGEVVEPGVLSVVERLAAEESFSNRTPLSLGRGAGGEGTRWTSIASALASDERDEVKDTAARQGNPSPLTPLPRERGTEYVAKAVDVTPHSAIPTSLDGRRLALANWIASPRNPLTARVIVNRIWQQHFGTGLAANPNNFGKMGKKPSHPELLDWLATELIRQDWSLKAIHRLIMTSAAYRRSATPVDAERVARVDADNRLLSYFPPRRLSAEELRDASLVASGEFNPAMGGIPIRPEINREIAFQPRHVMGSVNPAYQPSRTPAERNRRTVYALKIRSLRDPLLEVFDQPTPDLSCERRSESTVAPQAFSLFNSEASAARALAMACRCAEEADETAEQVEKAFEFAFGRLPTDDERELAIQHVKQMTARYADRTPSPQSEPTRVERELVEEQTGTTIRWSERLDIYEDYMSDVQPWEVPAETRALADLCLVLLNGNEFLYVY